MRDLQTQTDRQTEPRMFGVTYHGDELMDNKHDSDSIKPWMT